MNNIRTDFSFNLNIELNLNDFQLRIHLIPTFATTREGQ